MNQEKYDECKNHALVLIQSVTNETDEMQYHRYCNDANYKRVIDHLTQTFLLIATNEHFQREKEMEYLKAKNDLAHFAEMISGEKMPEYQKQLLKELEMGNFYDNQGLSGRNKYK